MKSVPVLILCEIWVLDLVRIGVLYKKSRAEQGNEIEGRKVHFWQETGISKGTEVRMLMDTSYFE